MVVSMNPELYPLLNPKLKNSYLGEITEYKSQIITYSKIPTDILPYFLGNESIRVAYMNFPL